MDSLGSKIRFARFSKCWTLQQLAARVGVTPSAVLFWECNRRTPQEPYIKKLEEVLGVTLSTPTDK